MTSELSERKVCSTHVNIVYKLDQRARGFRQLSYKCSDLRNVHSTESSGRKNITNMNRKLQCAHLKLVNFLIQLTHKVQYVLKTIPDTCQIEEKVTVDPSKLSSLHDVIVEDILNQKKPLILIAVLSEQHYKCLNECLKCCQFELYCFVNYVFNEGIRI